MGEPERSVSNLGLPANFTNFIKNDWGIETLHPPQADAMPSILQGKNTMVCIPTASGKSLVAYMGIVNQLLTVNPGSRGIYIVPLKALVIDPHSICLCLWFILMIGDLLCCSYKLA